MRTRNWNLSAGTTSSTTRWNVGIEDSVSYMGMRDSGTQRAQSLLVRESSTTFRAELSVATATVVNRPLRSGRGGLSG